MPIDRRLIVFDNFNGKGYGCNPKYVAEALADSGLRLAWLTNETSGDFPSYVKPIQFDSFAALKALATAAVRVDNVRNYKGVPKREGQFFIQTWHGMMPFKKVERQVEGLLSPRYVQDAKLDGLYTDLMVANNYVDMKLYENWFWYDGPVLLAGLPRMKPIVNPDASVLERVRMGLGIPEGAGVLLFAPTFRDFDPSYIPPFDSTAIAAALKELEGRPYVCLLRAHPNSSLSSLAKGAKGADLIDASYWPDAQELLAIADFFVSDYSGMVFDAAMAGKPVFLYEPDRREYESLSREFSFRPEDAPFPLCEDIEALINAILRHDESAMREAYGRFFDEIGLREDGQGDRVLAELILDWCGCGDGDGAS